MAKPDKIEWITAQEVVDRTGSSRTVIGSLRKANKLTTKKNTDSSKRGEFLYKWPLVKKEYEKAQEEKKKQIAAFGGRPKFDFNAKEYEDLSAHEKVLAAIEMGAKNAPDLAYVYAKAVEQQVKTRLASIKLLEAEGKTLTKAEVEHMAFSQGRQHRDHWLNWPERIAIKMGEELGVDTKLCHDVLKKYVRLQLERTANEPIPIPPDLSGTIPEGGDATSEPDS